MNSLDLRAGRRPAFSAVRFPSRGRASALAAALAGVALLGGCTGGRGGNIPYNPVGFEKPDPPSTKALPEDYRVSPLDVLKVSVFQVPDLSGDFTVDLTGNISMPLLGNVKVIDLTTSQINQKLSQMLGAKYLQHPDVNVGVKSSSTSIVTVEGSVNQSGVFQLTQPLTLIQVIAMAHGPDQNANPHRVAIFRQIKGQRMAAAFDLVSIRRGEAEDPKVYAGDIVVVDGSKIKSAWQTVLSAIPLLAFRPFGI